MVCTKASPVYGEVARRSRDGGVVEAAAFICTFSNALLPAVNPSVSLTADSSPYTGEPWVQRDVGVFGKTICASCVTRCHL